MIHLHFMCKLKLDLCYTLYNNIDTAMYCT